MITSAALRPVPVVTATLAAYFASFEAAAEASYTITRAELVDGPVLHAIDPALRDQGAAPPVAQCDGWLRGRGGGARAGAGSASHDRADH